MEQLNEFEHIFKKYLMDEQPPYHIFYNNQARLYSEMVSNTHFSVFSFNYTIPLISDNFYLVKKIPKILSMIRIHGEVENEHSDLIFGIDENELITAGTSTSYSVFTKTYRLLTNTSEHTPSLFNVKFVNIHIWGHSLSTSDYSYFFSIFDNQ